MIEPQDDAPDPARGSRGPGRRVVALAALGVAVAVLALAAALATSPEGPSRTTASPTDSRTTSPHRSAAGSGAPAATAVPPVEDPRARAELEQVAAQLDTALALDSPPLWDQWLPGGKPYPGVDLQDDLSTCPVLSARLETVVGQEMSYWTGTLPNAPRGCTWVEIPLSGQDNDYDYVIGVGFLADGTTAAEVAEGLRTGPGQGTGPCPRIDVPSSPGGAVLIRCAGLGTVSYTHVVPDTRLEDGLWVLTVTAEDSTPVRPAAIVPVLVDGVVAAYG